MICISPQMPYHDLQNSMEKVLLLFLERLPDGRSAAISDSPASTASAVARRFLGGILPLRFTVQLSLPKRNAAAEGRPQLFGSLAELLWTEREKLLDRATNGMLRSPFILLGEKTETASLAQPKGQRGKEGN